MGRILLQPVRNETSFAILLLAGSWAGIAAAPGNKESMRILLEGGADPNAANQFGATPLMWCAGDAAKVRLLLDKGAKVNVRSKLGRTPPLIAAAWDGAFWNKLRIPMILRSPAF